MGYLRPVSLGALLAVGHAPFNLWFLSFSAICLCFLDIVKQRKRSDIALYVMLLGIGYFILTLNWIAEPFFVDFRSHAWIAPFAIFFISVTMAFFWGFQRQNHEVFFTDKTILLVQPNAPQSEKWDENLAPVFFNRMIEATEQANDVNLIVWPESAIYKPLNYADELLDAINEASSGVPVVFGALRYDEGGNLRNSLVLNKSSDRQLVYDKSRLVPFGDYLPFAGFLGNLGLNSMVNSYGSSFTRGHGADLIEVETDLYFQPLICYEAIFPSILRATANRPDLIIQITNDAWFGRFSGPYQHLEILKMRAIETGIPVARSANTGISAVISANGKVIDSLPLETQGSLELTIPRGLKPTFYFIWGDSIFFMMILSLITMRLLVK
ncbi:MAG: apolipoprotein N-acyltransferase, partial [Rhodobacterales bacterium]|nr:apolipoprotein N-acyltransferase [Rhodobacterales bacterium]